MLLARQMDTLHQVRCCTVLYSTLLESNLRYAINYFAKLYLLSSSFSLSLISLLCTYTRPLFLSFLLSLSISLQPPPTSGTRSWGWV